MSYCRLNTIYSRMKDRCYNPKNIRYHCYGGRGITMTEDKKYYVYKMSGHYYTIDTKPVYEKVLFEGTEKECYEFVAKELENV